MKQKNVPQADSGRNSRKEDKRPLSFYPLTFDEAVTDILKAKPEPKKPKKKAIRDR